MVLYIRAWLVFILIIHYANFHFTFNLDHKHVAASYRTEENVSLNWPPFSVQIYMLYFVWTVVNSCGLDWTAWSLWTISFSIKIFFQIFAFDWEFFLFIFVFRLWSVSQYLKKVICTSHMMKEKHLHLSPCLLHLMWFHVVLYHIKFWLLKIRTPTRFVELAILS